MQGLLGLSELMNSDEVKITNECHPCFRSILRTMMVGKSLWLR